MKGVKAVLECSETMISGPVRVRVLARYNNYEVVCRVTGRSNRPWTKGLLFIIAPMFLWEKHRYVGRLKCNSRWQGRPDLSGLPEADENLIKQWEQQR